MTERSYWLAAVNALGPWAEFLDAPRVPLAVTQCALDRLLSRRFGRPIPVAFHSPSQTWRTFGHHRTLDIEATTKTSSPPKRWQPGDELVGTWKVEVNVKHRTHPAGDQAWEVESLVGEVMVEPMEAEQT